MATRNTGCAGRDGKTEVDAGYSAEASGDVVNAPSSSFPSSSSPRSRKSSQDHHDESDILDYDDDDDSSHRPENMDTSEAEANFNSAVSALNLDNSDSPLPTLPFKCQCVPYTIIEDANPDYSPNVVYPDDIGEKIFQTKTEVA